MDNKDLYYDLMKQGCMKPFKVTKPRKDKYVLAASIAKATGVDVTIRYGKYCVPSPFGYDNFVGTYQQAYRLASRQKGH